MTVGKLDCENLSYKINTRPKVISCVFKNSLAKYFVPVALRIVIHCIIYDWKYRECD